MSKDGLVDLKRTKKEKHGEKEPAQIHGPEEDYPYGTRISLQHEELQKLGMSDSLPKVGSVHRLHGLAHVIGVSEDHNEGGKKRRRVELHIRKMALHPHKGETPGRVPGKHSDAADGAKAAMDGALASAGEPDGDEDD